MIICRKCQAMNEEGSLHCRGCNAPLPIQIGSKAPERWERVPRQPELVERRCPSCGTANRYTRFRCQACGANLTKKESKPAFGWWFYLGIGLLVLAGIAFLISHLTAP